MDRTISVFKRLDGEHVMRRLQLPGSTSKLTLIVVKLSLIWLTL